MRRLAEGFFQVESEMEGTEGDVYIAAQVSNVVPAGHGHTKVLSRVS